MYYLYKILNGEKHYFTGTSLSPEFKAAKLYTVKQTALQHNKKMLQGMATLGITKTDN